MPSNHLILCHPLLLLPSIFPSIRVFSNESVLYIRWPKYCSFSIILSKEIPGLISFRFQYDVEYKNILFYSISYWSQIDAIDAFELWCWRRLPRAPWTARRSNQSILKEISPEYSLEGLMLKLQYFGNLMEERTPWKRP